MLKKILCSLLCVLTLCSCSDSKQNGVPINTDITLNTEKVDMSVYEGMTSFNHNFEEVNLFEVYDYIENGGSGLFYLGYSNCSNCQAIVKYMDEAAQELDVTIYYIDIDKDEYNILGDKEAFYKILEFFEPVLRKEDGSAVIYTPELFQVINGEFGEYHIGISDDWNYDNPTESQIENMKEIYRQLMEPFTTH